MFPRAEMISCLFDFGQSLSKKLVKCGFKQVYLSDNDLQVWFKSVFTLAFLPVESVDERVTNLFDQMTDVLSLKPEIGRKGGSRRK